MKVLVYIGKVFNLAIWLSSLMSHQYINTLAKHDIAIGQLSELGEIAKLDHRQ
jgi:putative exporter of polyketide antibiotics